MSTGAQPLRCRGNAPASLPECAHLGPVEGQCWGRAGPPCPGSLLQDWEEHVCCGTPSDHRKLTRGGAELRARQPCWTLRNDEDGHLVFITVKKILNDFVNIRTVVPDSKHWSREARRPRRGGPGGNPQAQSVWPTKEAGQFRAEDQPHPQQRHRDGPHMQRANLRLIQSADSLERDCR